MSAHVPVVLLPKVRSPAIMAAAAGMPCSLRIASFAGISCSGPDTTVCAHLPVSGKGVGTKVSDLATVFACAVCHDILDGRHHAAHMIRDSYPAAYFQRLLLALAETQARLLGLGIISVKDGRII